MSEAERDPYAEVADLQARRLAAVQRLTSSGTDCAAIMITHPRRREQMFLQMRLDAGVASAMKLMLAVIDKLSADRDTDPDMLLQPIVARAAAALAVVTVPDDVSSLLDAEPGDGTPQ